MGISPRRSPLDVLLASFWALFGFLWVLVWLRWLYGRPVWLPLAPILLNEYFNRYFSINKNIIRNLDWMGALCDANQELYNEYSSIIHIDGTCRTQIVKDEDSLTYKVLTNLKKSGSDILVNTSFNISKDPVVFDLYDVYANMKRMNIKFVLMDDGLYQTNDI